MIVSHSEGSTSHFCSFSLICLSQYSVRLQSAAARERASDCFMFWNASLGIVICLWFCGKYHTLVLELVCEDCGMDKTIFQKQVLDVLGVGTVYLKSECSAF